MLYGGLFIRAPLGDSKNNGSYPCYTYDGERSDQPPITYRWKPLLSCRHWTDHCIIRNRPQSLSHTLTWDTPTQAHAVLCWPWCIWRVCLSDKLDLIVLKAARYILELSECTESSYSLVEAVTVVYALTKVIYQPDCKLRGGAGLLREWGSCSRCKFSLPLRECAIIKTLRIGLRE